MSTELPFKATCLCWCWWVEEDLILHSYVFFGTRFSATKGNECREKSVVQAVFHDSFLLHRPFSPCFVFSFTLLNVWYYHLCVSIIWPAFKGWLQWKYVCLFFTFQGIYLVIFPITCFSRYIYLTDDLGSKSQFASWHNIISNSTKSASILFQFDIDPSSAIDMDFDMDFDISKSHFNMNNE